MASRPAPGVCKFAFSADLSVLVRCKIDRLLPASRAEELIGDEPLDIEVDLVLDGAVFRTVRSSQVAFDASPEQGLFRPQHCTFAIRVRDLPQRCSLVVRLRSAATPPCVYRGTLPLFNRRAVLRQGRQLLALLRCDGGADAAAGAHAAEGGHAPPRAAPAQADWAEHSNDVLLRSAPETLREAVRLAAASDLHARGALPPAAPGFEGSEEHFTRAAQDAIEAAGLPWLSIRLPVFGHPVLFAEPLYDRAAEAGQFEGGARTAELGQLVPAGVLAAAAVDGEGAAAAAVAQEAPLRGAWWLLQPLRSEGGRCFKPFVDHDAACEHPAVLKSLRLARSSRASRVKDRDARPNTDELRRLTELVRRPRRQFSAEEKHLIFRFRWTLTEQPAALTKFLHAVDWSDLEERQHAIELLGHWSKVDIDDALELLSKDFRGVPQVRRHAVRRLEDATDDEVQLYLLQLVQALRYETSAYGAGSQDLPDSPDEDAPDGAPSPPRRGTSAAAAGGEPATLTGFLIQRSVRSHTLATLFYWYVVAETDDQERGQLFAEVRRRLLDALGESEAGESISGAAAGVALRRKLLWANQTAKAMKRDRVEKKVEQFRQALGAEPPASDDEPACPLSLLEGLADGIPLPIYPKLSLIKIFAEQCSLLKSAMLPGVLACQVQPTGDHKGEKQLKKIMIKEGDDLRQDQLILQLIILMDSILKKYGLDLQLSPYSVIALSQTDGFIEMVPDSSNLSAILTDHNYDVMQFFRTHHPLEQNKGVHATGDGGFGPQNSYGIKPEVLDNFIKSCAGYCVITYILGIGDRHLDNLMVTRDGRLFHIDFGFILGKDPKPLPPPMRICKEMVEGMGGFDSPGYASFKSKCCQAYNILRRHAKLIINLLYLMSDSGIKDLCGDPQFAILKVEEKFQALMDDEQAEAHFKGLIDASVGALFPALMERLHKLSVALK
ncbi:unnamed protein product [Prorocentrum cordatum]|uniref:phosphatidylinositol 3-kinase n=1 Tax=Prorocentrum cordatum TaxID=2364126 RepID=A0ABN9VND5_9DINO|nr:unnamed protein product [Polarella glacialis]